MSNLTRRKQEQDNDCRKLELIIEAMRGFAKTEQGSKAFKYLFQLTSFYDYIEPSDPLRASFLLGERNVALKIRALFDKETLRKIEDSEL